MLCWYTICDSKNEYTYMRIAGIKERAETAKQLYPYQEEYIKRIFERLQWKTRRRDNIVFQLPTGGGKTVIFSEISRKFIEENQKKILILNASN
jgi:superfamily II DNA or RNA helicase